ncbi:MAG: MarR family transcriptional regulator [Propionibacteriaceae bacterium]
MKVMTTVHAPTIRAARPDLDELAQRLVVTSARFTRAAARLSPNESPTAAWRTLAILDEHGALRVSDLATLDRCSQPTATGMIQRLEADGLVTRIADAEDRRATLISLSPAGRERLANLRAGVAEALTPRLQRLDTAQIAELESALDTIHHLLDTGPVVTADPLDVQAIRTPKLSAPSQEGTLS